MMRYITALAPKIDDETLHQLDALLKKPDPADLFPIRGNHITQPVSVEQREKTFRKLYGGWLQRFLLERYETE